MRRIIIGRIRAEATIDTFVTFDAGPEAKAAQYWFVNPPCQARGVKILIATRGPQQPLNTLCQSNPFDAAAVREILATQPSSP